MASFQPYSVPGRWVVALVTAVCLCGCLTALSAAGRAQESIWSGIYSDAQAKRGAQLYNSNCSYCHRDDLSGGFFDDGNGRAPALAGARAFDSSFSMRWDEVSIAEMLATIAGTMPKQKPASLSLQVYVDILSYLLMKNEIPSGTRELSTDIGELQQIIVGPKSGR